MFSNNRSHGLDVLRCLAITLVFIVHYSMLTGQTTFGILAHTVGLGVDLSFILSGYFIGNQIFSTFTRGENFSIKNFYSRRLLRTLPSYLFILGLYLLIPGFREKPLVLCLEISHIYPKFWPYSMCIFSYLVTLH